MTIEELEQKDMQAASSKLEGKSYSYKLVHKDLIRSGDCIVWEGKLTTVGLKDIRYNSFTGVTIFGDSFHLGYRKLVLINFKI